MTKKKAPLKAAARRRMAITGETYQAAREAILSERSVQDEADLEIGSPDPSGEAPLFQEPPS